MVRKCSCSYPSLNRLDKHSRQWLLEQLSSLLWEVRRCNRREQRQTPSSDPDCQPANKVWSMSSSFNFHKLQKKLAFMVWQQTEQVDWKQQKSTQFGFSLHYKKFEGSRPNCDRHLLILSLKYVRRVGSGVALVRLLLMASFFACLIFSCLMALQWTYFFRKKVDMFMVVIPGGDHCWGRWGRSTSSLQSILGEAVWSGSFATQPLKSWSRKPAGSWSQPAKKTL